MSVALRASVRRPSLLATFGLLLLALLGCNRGLWTPDEPREAEISREMSLSPGVIPTLDNVPFIEKPPLYYWVVAALFEVTGGPSVLAARGVSVLAGLATLLLLYRWAAASHSRTAGILAACMLGTSLQFLVSTHWVLIDPLLMLATTLAAWAAWQLLSQRDGPWLCAKLYLALVLALWIKGLIGPALIGAGLLAYLLFERPSSWRRLRLLQGAVILSVAVGLLAWAIYRAGGISALWEWAVVNHVQRLINPLGVSGHRQPLPYYAWTLPYVVLPWLVAFWEALRHSSWRPRRHAAAAAVPDVARYAAVMSAAMLLLLSLAATKRETYLLPVLPLLFLWVGVRCEQWWQRWRVGPARGLGLAWWLQLWLLCLYALAAPVAAWIWRRQLDSMILLALLPALSSIALLLWMSLAGRRQSAALAALLTAFSGSAILLGLAPPLLDGIKNMGPFVTSIGHYLPVGEPIYAANVDETLAALVPFYTGRRLVIASSSARPAWLLVQDNHDGRDVAPPAGYRLVAAQSFGPGRRLMLWRQLR